LHLDSDTPFLTFLKRE
jgi:hypothetical protein